MPNQIETRILSSLHKVFFTDCPVWENPFLSVLANEPASFQVAYRLLSHTDPRFAMKCPIYVQVQSDLPISLYSVGNLPVVHATCEMQEESRGPGLYPDVLWPKAVNPPLLAEGYPWNRQIYFEQDEAITLYADCDAWQSLWVVINEEQASLVAGEYPVTLRFFCREFGDLMCETTFSVTVLGTELPKQNLIYTNWFHCDCLADTYDLPIFSDRYFEIFTDYVEKAARNGMNMLLLPAFTPALDTPEGQERKTAQLVGVTVEKGTYSFDFSRMKRYLDAARAAGIEYFEHAHFFTQWGSKAAPKIMATVDGELRQIFGWHTPATGEAYTAFLCAYLPALVAFLEGEGLHGKVLFHISDEPSEKNADAYRKAKEIIGHLTQGYMTGDALSHYSFYANGTVETPIVAIHALDDFLGRCDNLWAYYTSEPTPANVSNRLITDPAHRNRVLGMQMYYHNIKGFLHWGYNYYYDVQSHGLFDPLTHPCGFMGHPGSSYLVYPHRNGTALQSARQKVFYEAINDMRALERLESLVGREKTIALIERHFGKVDFETIPATAEQLLHFRAEVNLAIANAI